MRGQSRPLTSLAMLAPLLVLYAGAYLFPLGGLVADSLNAQGGLSFANYVEELTSPAFGLILVRTVWMSIVVTALCLILGYPVAYVISRLQGQVAAALLLIVSVPYLTSILIRTYAWIVVLSPNGVINQLLRQVGLIDAPIPLVFNTIGVYVGMVQVQLPLMIFPLYAAMTRIDRSLVSAARSLGSTPLGAFFSVFAPLTAAGVAGGSTLVFLSCLGFYVTPALLGGQGDYMLSQGISVRVLRLADFSSAATQATILLILVVSVFVAFRKRIGTELTGEPAEQVAVKSSALARRSFIPEGLGRPFRPILSAIAELISLVRWPVLWVATAVVLLFLIAPLFVVVLLAFSSGAYLTFPPPGYSLRWFQEFFADRQWMEATWFSIRVGLMAGLLSLAIGVPAAFALVRHAIVGRLATYLLAISPLVVPQVVVAVALYFVMARVKLVGTDLGFLIAYMLLGVPYVVVLMIAGLQRFDRSLERAAASLGANIVDVLRTVTLPLLLPTLVSALMFAFIVAFDDVVFGLFISGRGATPLPIRMWDDIRLEISPQIAVVAVLLFATLAAVYLIQLAYFAATRSRRQKPKSA